MHGDTSRAGARGRSRRLSVWLLACTLLTGCAHSFEYGGTPMIMPGMNQTELQAVMGPPDYIQVRGPKQAWQFCPHWFDGRSEDLYVTVWFSNARVDHMRAYPDKVIASCPDFLAAFRWEDVIEGGFVVSGASLPPPK